MGVKALCLLEAVAHLLCVIRIVRRLTAVVGPDAKDERVGCTIGHGLSHVIGIVLRNHLEVLLAVPAKTLTVSECEGIQADRTLVDARPHTVVGALAWRIVLAVDVLWLCCD